MGGFLYTFDIPPEAIRLWVQTIFLIFTAKKGSYFVALYFLLVKIKL
jgi:phage shock protein PspC (stress-responsive transcriptional regulator)